MNYAPFEIIRKIYLKEDISDIDNTDVSLCLTVSKYLSYDSDNLPFLKKIVIYIFNISAENYLYLLWLGIPKKSKVPFLRKIDKIEQKKDKLYEEIQSVLEWSEKELEFNKGILDRVISKNRKFWEKELGI
jgi:hypothetical protein